jgi:hypothetical protein
MSFEVLQVTAIVNANKMSVMASHVFNGKVMVVNAIISCDVRSQNVGNFIDSAETSLAIQTEIQRQINDISISL